VKFHNFTISKNNIICAKAAKVLRYQVLNSNKLSALILLYGTHHAQWTVSIEIFNFQQKGLGNLILNIP